jgi:hypothetical protein
MKSIHLTLTGLTIAEVLKALHEQAIPVTYIGTDQNFNILYQVTYSDEKEDIIGNILKYINDYEKAEQEFDLIIENALVQYFSQWTESESIKKIIRHFSFRGIKKILKRKQDYENGKH